MKKRHLHLVFLIFFRNKDSKVDAFLRRIFFFELKTEKRTQKSK